MKASTLTLVALVLIGSVSCEGLTGTQETVRRVTQNSRAFAEGVRGVKVITAIPPVLGSFESPNSVPVNTLIPSDYPGADGSSTYLPGISATTYFSPDSGTGISRPDWIRDVQLGITSISGNSGSCATFGGTGNYDVEKYYRISERNCAGVNAGNPGGTQDQAFIRIILNRDTEVFGSRENLLVQVEYQATGLRFNLDATGAATANPEQNLDQLWKVFWYSSLQTSTIPSPFSVFVPPVYAAQNGTGGAGTCTGTCPGSPQGAPVTVKQVLLPLSAYPDQAVIQFSRIRGRIDDTNGDTYIDSFVCGNDSPLCLGLVIRSITIMRI